jgi:hypothetical protein
LPSNPPDTTYRNIGIVRYYHVQTAYYTYKGKVFPKTSVTADTRRDLQ